jgi:hypothetical protein
MKVSPFQTNPRITSSSYNAGVAKAQVIIEARVDNTSVVIIVSSLLSTVLLSSERASFKNHF